MFVTLRRYSKKKQAQKARAAAEERLADALQRKDSRDIHAARMAMAAATTALLRAENVKVIRR